MKKEKNTREKYYEPLMKNLEKIQIDRGITQKAMGEYMDMDHSQYSKILKGSSGISIPQLAKLASGLDMRIIDLFTYPDIYVLETETDDKVESILQIKLSKRQKQRVFETLFDNKTINILE